MADRDFVLRLTAAPEHAGERLDRLVVEHLAATSRSFVQRLIEEGRVLVDDTVQRPSYRVTDVELIEERPPVPEVPEEITPADIMNPIAYEDDDAIVFDKPA